MKKRSFGHVVGWVTVLALGTIGTAQALPGTDKVDSGDIVDGQVKRVDIGAKAVTGAKVADGSLTGADLTFKTVGTDQLQDDAATADIVGDDAVRGYHVLDGSLRGADLAQNSSLTGAHIDEESLDLTGNCGQGTVHGWVHIETNQLSNSPTAVGGYNCAGQAIRAQGSGGLYRVWFDGNPSWYAVVSMANHSPALNETVAAYREQDTGAFVVRVTDASSSTLVGGGSFNLMLF